VSRGQSPLTVRVPDDLRARIDERAGWLGVSRDAWIVQALLTELEVVAPAPKLVGRERPRRPYTRARIMPTGSHAYRAVDVASGDTIEGTVRNMRHTAEDEARRLGYEVVDS
jgi:Ribbon-helix-helix protein, copG family